MLAVMTSSSSRVGRSLAALSVIFVPALLSACGGLVTVVKGDDVCDTPQGTFAIGEEFPAGDGCNTCVCEAGGEFSCTLLGCAQCDGPVPPCAPPSFPGCVVDSVCSDDGSWTCEESCDDCAGAPPIDCSAPMGCYYTGPICAGDHYECGELVCEKDCSGPIPDCPPPIDPNCVSYADCFGDGWFCATECGEPTGTCEEQFPAGLELVWYLVGTQCGCVMGQPCSDACANGPFCEGGPGPEGECQSCIQDAASFGEQCVTDAAFGDACQSDFECASYIECIINM
jgi:hypothetical protein